MKKLFIAALAVGCLPAAAGLAAESKRQYVLPAAVGVPTEQLARVVGAPGPKNRPAASFDALFDSSGREIRKVKFPAVSVVADELLLTPGRYYISVNCNVYGERLPGPVSIELAAGQTYRLWCIPVKFSAPVVRFSNEPHAQWDAKVAGASEGNAQVSPSNAAQAK